jgi:hypothetical protein
MVPSPPNGHGGKCCLLATAPKCLPCGTPQALLFDEGCHSHNFNQFQTMEGWIAIAKALVFCGTSFAITLTEVALEHARAKSLPVCNFNAQDFLEAAVRLDVANVSRPSQARNLAGVVATAALAIVESKQC